MDPELWGPHAWIFLHYVTFSYPDKPTWKDKQNMRDFINLLPEILPCHKCKMNCASHLKDMPLNDSALSSRSSLVQWLVDFHNCVNKMNGKKELTLEEALEELFPKKKTNYTPCIIFIVILFFLFLFYLFFRKNSINQTS